MIPVTRMLEWSPLILWLGTASVLLFLTISTLFALRLKERTSARAVKASAICGFISSMLMLGSAIHKGPHIFQVTEFLSFELLVTVPIAAFLATAHIVLAAVARFAGNYMHRDPGYQRFMMLFVWLQMGFVLVALSAEMTSVFFGWELAGTASVLLIGFFMRSHTAGSRSLWAFAHYKIADVFLILACALLHSTAGHVETYASIAARLQAEGNTTLLLSIGLTLILGTLAKGGLFPCCTWMPRAMEGPTPSSAAFYGALSVHLAPFLLLKMSPLWFWSVDLRVFVGALGLLTALMTSAIGRTVANIKGQLAYAVMSQIGVIYCELALGFHNLALTHIICHSLLRTSQYLRSAGILQHVFRNRMFEKLSARSSHTTWTRRFFLHAWNGFYLEQVLVRLVVRPTLYVAKSLNVLSRGIMR